MQQKLFKYGWAFLVGTLFAACSKTPDGVLTQKQMTAVQVDMMKAQTLCNTDAGNLSDNAHREALYRSVFEKHGITQAFYDSSLVWYGRNLDIYLKVCDKIDAVLSKEQKALGDIQAAALAEVKKDSADIWPRRPSFMFENNSMFTGTTFRIQPKEPYSSGSIFILNAKVWGFNKKMKEYPKVCIMAHQLDTLVAVTREIRNEGDFSLELHTVPTKKVASVYGYIYLNNQDSAVYNKIYFDNVKMLRVNYGRIAKTQADSIAIENKQKK